MTVFELKESMSELEFVKEKFFDFPEETGISNDIKNIQNVIKAIKELEDYYSIGTVEECRDAREKQVIKKPKKMEYKPLFDFGWRYACPSCGCAVGENEHDGEFTQQDEYCATCGQKLEWQ